MIDGTSTSPEVDPLPSPATVNWKDLLRRFLTSERKQYPPSDEVIRLLRDLHNGASEMPATDDGKGTDQILDLLVLGHDSLKVEKELPPEEQQDLLEQHVGQALWLAGENPAIWTPYSTIRAIVNALDLTDKDTFYDLGAGYGRVTLYAGAVSDATCKGVELVPHRAQIGEQAAKRLKLDNVEMIAGDVTKQDWSDGNIFFMFSPFSGETFGSVKRKLRTIAQEKEIRIVGRQMASLRVLPWLKVEKVITDESDRYTDVVIYKSIPEQSSRLRKLMNRFTQRPRQS